MARILAFIAGLALAVLGLAGDLSAQAQQPAPADVDKAIEQLRSDARTEVNALIGNNMRFTADEAAKFWPLYKTYEAERKSLTDERLAILKDYATSYSQMSDAQATQLMDRALALEEKAAAAKRKFLSELRGALPGKTVARFYQVHNRIDMMVELMLAQQVPLVQ